jgi:uncharacterized protein YukE
MPGTIKISASELEKLSKDAKQQEDRVQTVSNQVNSAVSGTDWRSSAAESFKALWQQDKRILSSLQHDLGEWSKHCASQVEPARRINRPF